MILKPYVVIKSEVLEEVMCKYCLINIRRVYEEGHFFLAEWNRIRVPDGPDG